MAFVTQPIPDNEQNKNAPIGQTTPNPAQLPPETSTGGSVGQGGGSSANTAPGVGSPSQFGSNASKLSDYLSANADQVQTMGNNIAGTLNQNFGQIKGDVDTAAQGFGDSVNAGFAAPNPDLVTKAASNPTEFVKDPNNVSGFKAQLNDAYTGPVNFESTAPYSTVQGEVNQAVQGAGLLNNHAGLSGYLQRNVENNPTPGQNMLDTALLESQPGAIKTVQDAAKPFSGLTDYLGNATKTANTAVPVAQQAAQKTAADTQAAFTGPAGVVPTFTKSLQSQTSKANADRDTYNAKIQANQTAAQQYRARLLQAQQDAINKYSGNVSNLAGNPTAAAAEKARINALIDPQPQLSSLDQYLGGKTINQPATSDTTATSDQYGEDAALAELLGTGYTPNLNPANADKAGSFSVPAMPGTAGDPSGEIQYMGDIADLYGNPYGITNANPAGGWNNPDISSVAQAVINASRRGGQGVNPDADTIAALQRLIANSYAGR